MPSRTPPNRSGRATCGAVLAGGASSRMGEPKAGVSVAGRPLIEYPIEALRAAGLEPVVVAKPGSPLPEVSCAVIEERDARRHPAAGMVAALRAADGGPVVVVACDMPFTEPGLIDLLAGLDAVAAVPMVGGRLEPLLARYSSAAIPVLEGALARGGSLHGAVRALDPLIIDEGTLSRFGDPAQVTFNVNDRAELAAAERSLAAGARR